MNDTAEQKPIITTQTAPLTAPAAPSTTPSAQSPAPAGTEIDIEQFAQVQLRVGLIKAAENVPKSKKLLKLQVDLGPLGQRQILSGIALQYTPETLVGRKVIIVANLKPARLMGLESQGMLLAASTESDGVISLLQTDQDLPPGSVVR